MDCYLAQDKSDLGEVTSVIRVKSNEHFLNLLLDTGSFRSVIGESTCKKLGVQIHPVSNGIAKCLLAADNGLITLVGEAYLTLEIQDAKIQHKFYVMPNLSAEILCGMEFILQNGVKMDHQIGEVEMMNGQIKLPFIRKESYLGLGFLCNGINIPANSEKVLSVQSRRKLCNGLNVSVKPLFSTPKNLTVYSDTTCSGNGTVNIRVRNESNKGVKIRRFTPLCSLIDEQREASLGTYRPTETETQYTNADSLQNCVQNASQHEEMQTFPPQNACLNKSE